ncbi:MAG: hypothetical protein J6K55_14140 [Clostridia bacterium]|nr:hypothetical protein [Clostridia bacterium]
MVFDEDSGIAYDSYNSELIRVFLILAHYTDLDLSAYDTPEGRYEIYDILATNGLLREIMDIVEYDMDDVESIMHKVQCAAKRDFETKHSLGYRVGKAFESLLGTENLTETVAKAEKLNSKLIDMLAAVQNQLSAVAGSGLQFARKD